MTVSATDTSYNLYVMQQAALRRMLYADPRKFTSYLLDREAYFLWLVYVYDIARVRPEESPLKEKDFQVNFELFSKSQTNGDECILATLTFPCEMRAPLVRNAYICLNDKYTDPMYYTIETAEGAIFVKRYGAVPSRELLPANAFCDVNASASPVAQPEQTGLPRLCGWDSLGARVDFGSIELEEGASLSDAVKINYLRRLGYLPYAE